MPTQSPPVLSRDVPPSAAIASEPIQTSFDERWAAWQARGKAHDRLVRRKIAIVAPVVALLGVAVLYSLSLR